MVVVFIQKNDGQRHDIGPYKVMELYKVKPSECVVYGEESCRDIDLSKLIELGPRDDGNYDVFNEFFERNKDLIFKIAEENTKRDELGRIIINDWG